MDLSSEEVEVSRTVRDGVVAMHEAGLTIALEVSLDEPLLAEGLAREVVNKLNTMRRELDFAVTDRITVSIETTDRAKAAIEGHLAYVKDETLATAITFGPTEGTAWDLNGEPATIAIVRAER